MKIFIGKISEGLSSDDVREYFGTFGEIMDYNNKGSYAFVEYRDESAGRRVLENRDHHIKDYTVFVEESLGRKRQRFDSMAEDYPRRPAYGAYDDYPTRGRPQPIGGYDPYGARAPPSYYDDRPRADSFRPREQDPYGYPPRDPRDDCPHCSRCEVHGVPPRRTGGYNDYSQPKRPKRDHPNDVNKFVIESLPLNVSINDVEDFVKGEGYDVVFSRMTARGDAAIIELRDIPTKEDAMNKLQGREIKGCPVSIRNFKTSAVPSNDRYASDRGNETQENGDLYGGIDSVNVD